MATGIGALLGVIAAAVVWFLLPPAKYTAEALLLVEPEQPRLIAATREFHLDPETDRRTQATLIKSPLVLGKALSEPEVAGLSMLRRQADAYEWLESQIKAEFTGKILRLSLAGDRPFEVSTLVRAVTGAYLSEVAYKEKAQRRERNEILKDHYDRLQKQLESKRSQLRLLATQLGSNDRQTLSMQQRLAMAQQNLAEQELLRTQSDLRHALGQLKMLQARVDREASADPPGSDATPSAAEVEKGIQNDEVILGYIEKEEQLKNDLAYSSSVARRQSDPSVQRVRKELAKIQSKRKSYEAQLRSRLCQQMAKRDGRGQAEASLAALQDEIGVLEGMERDLQTEVGRFTVDTKKMGTQALDMESIQDEIASAVDMAKLIAAEIEALKIELNAPDRVRLLKEAKAPRTVDSSRKLKAAGMAAGGAFGAVILLVSFLEFRARRIDSLDDVTQSLGIKVVGTVPVVRRAERGLAPEGSDPREFLREHQLIEAVDTTRIMLSHEAGAGSYRMVLVTSAIGGEGKTSLSSYLATSLARSGKRTLLVDGDLRWPMVHRIYDQPQGPGLCELVRGEVGLEAAIRPTAIDDLWIIPVGHADDRVLSVLSQPHAQTLFDRLRDSFDFVIVDSAPVLPVADTLLLSQRVDAVLFSILREVSQVPKVQAAYGRIAALGVPILGAVVSGARVSLDLRYTYSRVPKTRS